MRGMATVTPKQERYARNVAAGMSYVAAYRDAYDVPVTAEWASRNAYNEKIKPVVARRIAELQKELAAKLEIKRTDLVRWHLARMSYNPDELIKTVAGACRHCHGDGHGYQWRAHDYFAALDEASGKAEVESKRGWRAVDVPLPDIAGGFGYNALREPHAACPNCDGAGIRRTVVTPAAELSGAARAAYEGVKETQHGVEVKMADKHASAVEVAKLLGFNVERAAIGIDDEVPDTDISALDTRAVEEVYRKMIGQSRSGARRVH
jgi:phage terminase small subunit